MRILFALLIVTIISNGTIYGQVFEKKTTFSIGITEIPLHINRTNLTRWMSYPSLELRYRTSTKIAINIFYLFQDLRTSSMSGEETDKYVETPALESYEQALMYIGNKFTISWFYDYLFIGIHYDLHKSKNVNVSSMLDVGYRFGETDVISYVTERPTIGNGYEIHSRNMNSDSPGLKLGISPKISFLGFISLEATIGGYAFINWPTFQPYGNLQIGFHF